jgi:nucleoprotein TPR
MLKVTEMDLATARSHVQQFQEISQANESALATLNAIHDEYKASTEAQIARLEVRVQIARLDVSLTNINLVGS